MDSVWFARAGYVGSCGTSDHQIPPSSQSTGTNVERIEAPIRITQLSDTHFLQEGAPPEGLGAYDTAVAFERVFADIDQQVDLVVVTGDVADHGTAEEYEVAAAAFQRFDVPVNICPGNHDMDVPFRNGFGGADLDVARVVELGNWAFLFVDSNSGAMVPDPAGDAAEMVDPPGETRLHGNGAMSDAELNWVREACAATDAQHVFVWIHHPPGVVSHFQANPEFTQQWTDLLADLANVRGFGAGHLHMPSQWDLAGRQVFLSPSLKNNFSLETDSWLPPGYRTYHFHQDGNIESEARFVDDEALWPRHRLGQTLRDLFTGKLTYEQMAERFSQRNADES